MLLLFCRITYVFNGGVNDSQIDLLKMLKVKNSQKII